jgi:hypothetical protein
MREQAFLARGRPIGLPASVAAQADSPAAMAPPNNQPIRRFGFRYGFVCIASSRRRCRCEMPVPCAGSSRRKIGMSLKKTRNRGIKCYENLA